MNTNQIYAVLTGDIVSSSRVSPNQGDQVFARIKTVEGEVKKSFPGALVAAIDVFRGDSWQLVLQEPERFLRIALLFRAVLISSAGIDSRVSVGFGPVDYLPAANISTGNGLAFTLSGKGLRDIQQPVLMNLNFPSGSEKHLSGALNTIVSLLDLQVQRWTRKQAQAISGVLVGLTQQQIGDSWDPEPVSQQAISQHLDSAGWMHIQKGLLFVEEVLPGIFKQLV